MQSSTMTPPEDDVTTTARLETDDTIFDTDKDDDEVRDNIYNDKANTLQLLRDLMVTPSKKETKTTATPLDLFMKPPPNATRQTIHDNYMSPAKPSRDLTIPSPTATTTQPLAPEQLPMTQLADFSNIPLSPPISPNTSMFSNSFDYAVNSEDKNAASSSNPTLFCNKSSGTLPNAKDMPCYHSVKGKDVWGLIFDPGAAGALSGTHTVWEYLN